MAATGATSAGHTRDGPLPDLPGGTGVGELQDALRRHLDRPALIVDRVECEPIAHHVTAPTTASLTRVGVIAHDREVLELRLVAKGLQSALLGLPPFVPEADREVIAAGIPWRLEWDVYTGDTADRMPPGLRLPELYAVTAHDEERLTLWLEDVDPVETPWTASDLARAATGLGRLSVRRDGQTLPTQPAGSFLAHLVEGLPHWAVPALRSDALWDHPAFRAPEVASLRPDLLALADEVDHRSAGLADLPSMQTHGDPTPMNVLRPRATPERFVLIDWGTSSRAPIGWDLVPLVFGPAENGTAPPDDLAARLAVAIPAFEAGLIREGMRPAPGMLAASVRTCALLRYPLTSLPLSEVGPGAPERDDLAGYAVRKAAFVRAVLDVCR